MKQLRIVTLGDWDNYYSYFLAGTMEGAIRCGAWFRPVPLYGHDLATVRSQIDFFKPHVLIAHTIFNRRPHNRDDVLQMLKEIRSSGCKVVYHMGDARTEPRYPHDISDIVDLGLVNHGLLDKFSSIWKIPCIHWPYMCLQQRYRVDPEAAYNGDVVFTGSLASSGVHSYRTDFIMHLKSRLDVRILPEPGMANTRFLTAEVASSAKVILGVQMGEHIPLYLDVRPFQYIGAGALYFHDKSSAMDKFFAHGAHYVSYERGNADDFLEKYTHYVVNHSTLGDEIRRLGFEYCQRWHSAETRMRQILDALAGKSAEPVYLERVLS